MSTISAHMAMAIRNSNRDRDPTRFEAVVSFATQRLLWRRRQRRELVLYPEVILRRNN